VSELAFLTAAELARRIARRDVSSLEAVDDALERVSLIDPGLSSYVLVLADEARAAARTADAELAAGTSRGPLHGVPMALKDIFDTAGIETTAGSKVLCGNIPATDAPVFAQLREAGAVLLGKLNMHEFAYGTTTANAHYGACRNPWDTGRSPGGSSGGSGAALAAGLCHLSLGTDTGGSIRIPAAACGIVGLKPTFGRVSRRGVVPLSWALDHVGPMTRSVEDAALVLNAIAGHDALDAWSSATPTVDYTADLERGVQGLRVGVVDDQVLDMVEAPIAQAVAAAIEQLARAGAQVISVKLPHLEYAQTALHAILASEASAFHQPWLRDRPEEYDPSIRVALELGSLIPAVDYINARRMQALVQQDFAAALDQVDAIALPALPRPPPAIGEAVSREPGVAWNRLMTPINLAGLPALALPCGFGPEDMPIGLQIVGRAWDEATVLRIGRAYERATSWHTRHPARAEA
jgi:aspartyl-tRNA(Asn)/glutamyl-tRNA(Gln) amidotransferase subunit A